VANATDVFSRSVTTALHKYSRERKNTKVLGEYIVVDVGESTLCLSSAVRSACANKHLHELASRRRIEFRVLEAGRQSL
jgi:hypothetical protein